MYVPHSKPPQEDICVNGRRAAVSVPPPVVLLRGRHEDHDHQPLLPQNSSHHGLTNAHHWGNGTRRCTSATLLIEKKRGKKRLLTFPIWSRLRCVFLQGESVSDSLFSKVIWSCTQSLAYKSAPPLRILGMACYATFTKGWSGRDGQAWNRKNHMASYLP